MGFDISKFAGSVPLPASESDAMLEVPVDDIVDNPKNFYPRPEGPAMNALRESIEANGLLEPPTVVPADGGKYRLISGHSRMSAIRRLRNDDHARVEMTHRWDTVLCRVLPNMSEDEELVAVIEANRQRVKSNALLADEAERLTAAYTKRQEAGEKLPGGIRAAVAEQLHVNATKISNLKAIKAGLKVPGIIARWERDELPEASALVIAKMDIDQQYRLVDWINENEKSWSISDVKLFANMWLFCRHDCPETDGLCPNAERITREKLRNGEFRCAGCCEYCKFRDACQTRCEFVREVMEPISAEPVDRAPARREELPEGQLVLCGWMPGGLVPAEPGEFAALMDLGHSLYHKFLLWTGAAWTSPTGIKIETTPVWWMRLPPVPNQGGAV